MTVSCHIDKSIYVLTASKYKCIILQKIMKSLNNDCLDIVNLSSKMAY